MANYVLAYHGGGMPETEEEGRKVMAAWEAWYGELGSSLVDGGAPTGQAKTVAPDGSVHDGGGANPLSGYTVVSASSIDEAVALAKGCPIVSAGGSIEVAEALDM